MNLMHFTDGIVNKLTYRNRSEEDLHIEENRLVVEVERIVDDFALDTL